jgi:UDP-N-acetylmuramoyl-L-alanyl-D-glutamate--2,6-diaminopimelate ligase
MPWSSIISKPMFKEKAILGGLLKIGRKIIPARLFKFAQPFYHGFLSLLGGMIFGFPSKHLKIVAVTGTKGKSTVVFMLSRVFEEQGFNVAAVGSLGFKIKEKTWPNMLKMTMPGRLKLQKFLAQARKAGCEFVFMEATSEGLAQNRLAGVRVDCAVYTNLHREHLESHGSFENYLKAKQKLFAMTKNRQVLNIDDPYFEKFANFKAGTKITFGLNGLINPQRFNINLKLIGDFNVMNALATLAVADVYRLDLSKAIQTLNSIETIPGRMEVIETESQKFKDLKFKVIVDYAHTPDSLRMVYENLRPYAKKLICVLGAAGGGRDKWKRPEFGKIAGQYCDEIILTNEDPYEEEPREIIGQIKTGIPEDKLKSLKFKEILDRGEAIKQALTSVGQGDIVIITGKGSETSIAVRGGRKIPWSDAEKVRGLLK